MRYRKGSFTIVPNKEALRGVDTYAQTLFIWICSYADDDGICYPSIKRLAEDCATSRSTIKKKIKVLEDIGLIRKSERKREDEDVNMTNLYQIILSETVGRDMAGVGRQMTEGGSSDDRGGGSSDDHRTQSNIELNPKNSIEGVSFDDFWGNYPVKRAKGKAKKKWDKLDEETQKQILQDIIVRQDSKQGDPQWLKEDGQFIPYPTTYLNQERWQDEWEPEKREKDETKILQASSKSR